MHRAGLLIGGWVAATALALAFGLLGVRAVSESVTNPRPAALSPTSVKVALARVEAGGQAAPSSSSDGPTSTSQSATSTSVSETSDSPSSGSVAPSSSDGGAPAATQSEDPTPAPPFSASQEPASSSSGGDDDSTQSGTAQYVVYKLDGGTVRVRFENHGAYLDWATPNSGYTMTNGSSGGEVEIEFTATSGEHVSHLHAYWDGGPQAETDEGD